MNLQDDTKLRSATTSDEEITSSDNGRSPISLVGTSTCSSILGWIVLVFVMLVNWGVSLLPAIFFVNPRRLNIDNPPVRNASNYTLPPLHYPCNNPLKKNPSSEMCELLCTWTYFTDGQSTAQHVVDNISLTISLLGLVFILLTWMSLKQLRVFPNIIPLYIQGTSSCISLLIVIGNGMNTKKAFCNKEFQNDSMENPTPFCVAQGMLIQYLSNVTALWFIVYSICLVQMVFSKNTIDPRQSTKLQHAISAACCYLLPWILVGVVFNDKGYGMVINGRLCLPQNDDLSYYTNSMITEIGLGVGCSCLLIVVFKLVRLRNLAIITGEQGRRRKSRMDKIAIRLVCLMFAYAICSSLVYIPICVQLSNKEFLQHYIKKYVGCLMYAPAAEFCKEHKIEMHRNTYANTFIASYITSGLFTISTVCFLAFNRQSRRLWQFWWQRVVDCCCLPEEDPDNMN